MKIRMASPDFMSSKNKKVELHITVLPDAKCEQVKKNESNRINIKHRSLNSKIS